MSGLATVDAGASPRARTAARVLVRTVRFMRLLPEVRRFTGILAVLFPPAQVAPVVDGDPPVEGPGARRRSPRADRLTGLDPSSITSGSEGRRRRMFPRGARRSAAGRGARSLASVGRSTSPCSGCGSQSAGTGIWAPPRVRGNQDHAGRRQASPPAALAAGQVHHPLLELTDLHPQLRAGKIDDDAARLAER